MHRVFVVLFIAFLAAASVSHAPAAAAPHAAPPEVRLAQDDETFILGEGRFEIEGRAPRGFNEFRYLYLEGAQLRRGSDPRRLTPVTPASVKGELYGRRKFRIRKAAFDGEQLSFETQAVGGVSFQFSGTVYNGATAADQIISPAFKGRLLKFMNGKKVAEAQVTFGHLEPEF